MILSVDFSIFSPSQTPSHRGASSCKFSFLVFPPWNSISILNSLVSGFLYFTCFIGFWFFSPLFWFIHIGGSIYDLVFSLCPLHCYAFLLLLWSLPLCLWLTCWLPLASLCPSPPLSFLPPFISLILSPSLFYASGLPSCPPLLPSPLRYFPTMLLSPFSQPLVNLLLIMAMHILFGFPCRSRQG